MALIWIKNVTVSFGGPLLLDGADLQIETGERIGLLGRNGSGKSTLLKVLAGEIPPDKGEIIGSGAVRIALLPQEVPDDVPGTVYDVVASGSPEHLELLSKYHELALRVGAGDDTGLLGQLERIQHQLETSGAWHYHQQVETVISRCSLDGNDVFETLSAGMKRRVFLARALAGDPALLLLDEPTNHLDMNAILWLEEFLLKYDKTLLFVTHDRAFLRRLATRIVEIDRGRLRSFSCDYAAYLERRQALLEAEEKQWQDFDEKLAKEEIWVRQGIKARRTRNEGRVRALLKMRQERSARRERDGSVRIAIQEEEKSGRLVAEVKNVGFSYGDKKIIDGFSTVIMRGDRVGIIGPNGAGKTTLLRILLGELEPRQGSVRLGTRLQIAYFDQLRGQLDEELTLKENVSGGNDTIFFNGAPRHIVGYLQDFLFPPAQILAPVRSLSGGERNRLLLAKLFTIPANVLVLDEPTNDLDAETLELLEECLSEYGGTVLMVSHDREFLNNVVTSTIVFTGDGRLAEYVGGYDDWLRQRAAEATPAAAAAAKPERPKRERTPKEKTKLSYKEKGEFEALPQRIEALEAEKRELLETLNSPAFYADNDGAKIRTASDRLEALERELDRAYVRWDELDALAVKGGD